MKYSILGFNQSVVLKYKKSIIRKVRGIEKEVEVRIDVTDLLLINALSDFMNRPNIIKSEVEGKNYFWVNYSTLLEDLPILDISKQALSDRLNKLSDFNIIEKKVVLNSIGTFTCFRMGEEYENIKYSSKNQCKNDDTGSYSTTMGGSYSTTKGGRSQLRGGVVVNYDPNMNTLNNEYAKEKKEDTNVSKKDDISSKRKTNKQDVYKEIVDYWNEHVKSYSKVRQVTAKIKSAINARIKDGYSVDDIKKALLLCESLGDFYKGKEPGKNWKASFYWIICNTNSNFDKILAGDLHTTNEQQREFGRVMNGEEYNNNEYHPIADGFIIWNEYKQYYQCFNPWDLYNLPDGYKPEERPDGAVMYCQGLKYVWSKDKKEWIQNR